MQKNREKISSVFALALFGALLFWASPVLAAEFRIKTADNPETGAVYRAELTLDAPAAAVNAISGELLFPSDILTVDSIIDGNSIVNFWVDKPRLEEGKIVFSGIVPGGYDGTGGRLFSVSFVPKKIGSGEITLSHLSALLNDGLGTADAVTSEPLPFTIAVLPQSALMTPFSDVASPESFVPIVSSSPDIFDGAYFLAFTTQDKGTGIDHYEIQETSGGKIDERAWKRAESPYLLRDQALQSYIRVKAVDRAGNVRLAELPPLNTLPWYEVARNWIIMTLLAIVIIFFVAWRFLAHRKN